MDEQDTSIASLDECDNKGDNKWIWEGFVGEGTYITNRCATVQRVLWYD